MIVKFYSKTYKKYESRPCVQKFKNISILYSQTKTTEPAVQLAKTKLIVTHIVLVIKWQTYHERS